MTPPPASKYHLIEIFLHLQGRLTLTVYFLYTVSVFTLKNVNSLNHVFDGCLNHPQCQQVLIYELRADYVMSGPPFFSLQILNHS